jgi:hypothetical protein
MPEDRDLATFVAHTRTPTRHWSAGVTNRLFSFSLLSAFPIKKMIGFYSCKLQDDMYEVS